MVLQLQSMRVRNHTVPSNPIYRTTVSSDLASKMVLFNSTSFLSFSCWSRHQKNMFTSSTFLLRCALYSFILLLSSSSLRGLTLLLWSCTNFWEISSSHSARLLLQPQSLYSTTLSINLGFLCCAFAQLTVNPMSLTVGKPFSSPLTAFFLIPAHCNSSSTVIIILKSHSGWLQREDSVYQRMHTDTHRAELRHKDSREERGHLEVKTEGQSAAVPLSKDASGDGQKLHFRVITWNKSSK